jgi:hypothetical protein
MKAKEYDLNYIINHSVGVDKTSVEYKSRPYKFRVSADLIFTKKNEG